MNKQEMQDWLHLEDNKNEKGEFIQVYMPNEIFEDLEKQTFKSWKHKPFAYAYYYLTSYIYRNALYGVEDVSVFGQVEIILTLISSPTLVSYITKKNGMLDKIGYLKSIRNYPISYHTNEDGIFEFTYIDDIKEFKNFIRQTGSRFFVKEPIKALNRFGEYNSGTFYDMQNTHLVTIQRFIDIITDEELGTLGLYLYAYLSMMCDKYKDGFTVSNEELSKFLGCNKRTVSKYTIRLQELGFIDSTRKMLGYKALEKNYTINDPNDARVKFK